MTVMEERLSQNATNVFVNNSPAPKASGIFQPNISKTAQSTHVKTFITVSQHV